MQHKGVIGVFHLPLTRWNRIIFWSSNIQIGCKEYQGVIHNTYNGEHIETDRHVI